MCVTSSYLLLGIKVVRRSSQAGGGKKPIAAGDWHSMIWAKLLPESEALSRCGWWEMRSWGLPHPCSAGPDIIVQVSFHTL